MNGHLSSVAVIGGTGFENALQERLGASGDAAAWREVATDCGTARVAALPRADAQGGPTPLLFMARHGMGHTVAPHRIDHRANIAALHASGARWIVSTSAVGSVAREYAPGDVVVPDDFIDLRLGQPVATFFEGEPGGPVRHTDFSEPFSAPLRRLLLAAGAAGGVAPLHGAATYLCLSGPRYETPAEVRCFAGWGAHLVGMTVAPEAILARELGMGYASVSVVTNYGTGLAPGALSHAEVEAVMAQRRGQVVAMLVAALAGVPEAPGE